MRAHGSVGADGGRAEGGFAAASTGEAGLVQSPQNISLQTEGRGVTCTSQKAMVPGTADERDHGEEGPVETVIVGLRMEERREGEAVRG